MVQEGLLSILLPPHLMYSSMVIVIQIVKWGFPRILYYSLIWIRVGTTLLLWIALGVWTAVPSLCRTEAVLY